MATLTYKKTEGHAGRRQSVFSDGKLIGYVEKSSEVTRKVRGGVVVGGGHKTVWKTIGLDHHYLRGSSRTKGLATGRLILVDQGA